MLGPHTWSLLGVAAWALWCVLANWLHRAAFRNHDPLASAIYRLIQLYAALVHRLKVEGAEHIPARNTLGIAERPLIIIANHTAGIDPLLIQAALPFEVRWVMASDMKVPALDPLWNYARVIFVNRHEGEHAGLRDAIRHLKQGATLGLFPEGGIERPPRKLLPFKEGIGLLVKRTNPIILPIIIEGTPHADPAWASLWRASRSRLRFLPAIDCRDTNTKAADIAPHLLELFARATGWPINEHPPKLEQGVWHYADEHGNYHPSTPQHAHD